MPSENNGDFSNLFLRAIRDIGKGEKTEQNYTDKRLDLLKRAADFVSMPGEKQKRYKDDMSTEEDIREYWEEQVSDARLEGKAEGLAEAQLEIARKMKAMALSVEQIAVATGLSIDEIQEL